ncbi:MAG: ATP-dependent DNA helicase [Defluviitaleaceae bacterium]|nr:ATP-dependent DNA helicase [Defluviitaleaceae bacterium]
MKTTNEFARHMSEIIYEIPENTPERYLSTGKFLFSAYGCAVLERQTPSGMYVYIAANLSSGEKIILSRRKVELSKDAYTEMTDKIYNSPIRGNSINNTDKRPGETSRENKLLDAVGHIFTKILPQYGYAVRENQIELAEHILEVVGCRGITLAESEVGTGKTHAYLVSAFLVKRGRLNDYWMRSHYKQQSWAESAHQPVVISTSSIALQKAIVTDYIPELSRILMEHGIIKTPLTAVIRKGKDHYICEKRLRSYLDAADAKTKKQLEPFLGWHGSNAPFDLTDADSLTPYMKKRICVSEKCGAGCKHKDRCRYAAYMKKANDPKVDFQITNHNYFLADTLHRASGKRPLLPHYQLVIMDEAHKFLQAARQMYGIELSDKELPALEQEIHAIIRGKSNGGVNVHRLAKKMTEQGQKLFGRLNDNIADDDSDDDTERLSAEIDGEVSRFLVKITNIIGELEAAVADSKVSKFHEERRDKVLWRLKVMREKVSGLRKQSKLIHWFEKKVEGQTKTDSLCAIPKDLNERLHNDLWSKGVPIILTSGTLSASGDFTRAKQTLGLDLLPERKLFTTSMPSPFDFKNNKLLYISENVPFPDNKDKRYIEAVADEIERLVIASHGHAAVLFTSYNAMGQVHAILKRRNLPFPLFRLERGGVHAIERFKKSGNGILMASGALWEGVDVPGDALSMLIIVKLPFAVPDPIGDYEREQCGSMALFKQRVIIPDMQVKLKQGDGRAIRTEKDTACCAILDIRAGEGKAYQNYVLSALPKSKVTSSIEAVRDFFAEKKPTAYFLPKNQF